MPGSGPFTDDGNRGWTVIKTAYLALARAFRVVLHGFDGSSYPAVSTDADGHLQVDVLTGGGSGGGTEFDDGDAIDTTSQGTLILGTTAVPGTAHPIKVAADGAVAVDVESMPTVTVTATDLDIRPLDSASDSVTAVVSGTVTVAEPVSVDDNGGTLSVDDGGASLTVDGTVAVSSVAGTVTVDTELPAAAAAADGQSDPTAPAVRAFGMMYDEGGTPRWDRVRGTTTNGLDVDVTRVQGTVTVGDGGSSLTVDGTVGVSGTVTVDSELPAAAALADNTANPTVPGVGGFGMVFDGSTWDRMPGNSTGGVVVQGPVAVDGAVGQLPVQVAFEADDSIKSAVSADGDVVRPWADRRGRTVVATQYAGENKSTRTVITASTAENGVSDNPASTAKLVIYALSAGNKSATKTHIDFKDGASGTIIWSMPLAADGGGFTQSFPDGLPLTADNQLIAQVAESVSSVYVNVLYKTVTV